MNQLFLISLDSIIPTLDMDNKKSKWPLVTTTVKYCGVKNVIFYLKYKNHIIKISQYKYLVLPATSQHLFVRLCLVFMTPGKLTVVIPVILLPRLLLSSPAGFL